MTGRRRTALLRCLAAITQRRVVAARRRAAALLVAAGMLTTSCGAVRAAHPSPTSTLAPPSLATSLVTAAGTWTVVPMGGSPAFWQLFRYPALGPRASGWSLVTPPGVADNGGLVLADLGGQSLVAGFRPSADLVYSPLATTADGGKTWSPGLLDAELADVPDALVAGASGHLLALLKDGTAAESASATGTSGWSQVTSERALAASAGRACDLRSLTAIAFSASGVPLPEGTAHGRARPGSSPWKVAPGAPWDRALPPSLAGQAVTTLRLATSERPDRRAARGGHGQRRAPARRVDH